MNKVRSALFLALAAFSSAGGATASAQDPLGLGYGYLFGYGAGNTSRISSFVPAPPYFALHPPVYYGNRYMRPYGESPFASWPQLQAAPGYRPHAAAPHAQVLVNPYAPCCGPDSTMPAEENSPIVSDQAPGPASAAAPLAVQPLVIDNPYYPAAAAGRLVTTGDDVADGQIDE